MTGKQIIMILLGLIAIFIVYLIFSKKYTTDTQGNPTATPSTSGTIVTVITGLSTGSFPLKKGSFGTNVTKLQNYLNSKGATLVPDGAFGSLTLAALKKYTGLTEVIETYFNTYILTGANSENNTNSGVIGKTAYAGTYGCGVYQTDWATYNGQYKVGANGEWLGVITGTKTTSEGKLVYILGKDSYNGFLYSPASCVVIK